MFDLFNNMHTYSLAATGIKFKEHEFNTRECAENKMYKVCRKLGLQVVEQYHDNHDRTYICNHGVRFYIQRNN